MGGELAIPQERSGNYNIFGGKRFPSSPADSTVLDRDIDKAIPEMNYLYFWTPYGTGEWTDNGLDGFYDVIGGCGIFRATAREFLESVDSFVFDECLMRRLCSLVGFARAYCISRQNIKKLYDCVSWYDIPNDIKLHALSQRVVTLSYERRVSSLVTARKLSLFVPFYCSWSYGISLLQSHYQGPLTRRFTTSEASLIIHMTFELPVATEWSFWNWKRYQEERAFRLECLLGALVQFLKASEVLDKSFHFRVESEVLPETSMVRSAAQFLEVFIDECMLEEDRI